jgi:hypothetical protein
MEGKVNSEQPVFDKSWCPTNQTTQSQRSYVDSDASFFFSFTIFKSTVNLCFVLKRAVVYHRSSKELLRIAAAITIGSTTMPKVIRKTGSNCQMIQQKNNGKNARRRGVTRLFFNIERKKTEKSKMIMRFSCSHLFQEFISNQKCADFGNIYDL